MEIATPISSLPYESTSLVLQFLSVLLLGYFAGSRYLLARRRHERPKLTLKSSIKEMLTSYNPEDGVEARFGGVNFEIKNGEWRGYADNLSLNYITIGVWYDWSDEKEKYMRMERFYFEINREIDSRLYPGEKTSVWISKEDLFSNSKFKEIFENRKHKMFEASCNLETRLGRYNLGAVEIEEPEMPTAEEMFPSEKDGFFSRIKTKFDRY